MWQYILHNTVNIYRKKIEEKDIQRNKRTLLQSVLSRNYLDILEVRCCKNEKRNRFQTRKNEKQMAAKLIADLWFLVKVFSQALLNVYVDFFLIGLGKSQQRSQRWCIFIRFFFLFRIKVLRCQRWTMTFLEQKGGWRRTLGGNDSKWNDNP